MRVSLPSALIVTAALAIVASPAALADSGDSSNWAGYAVHRSGVKFTKVLGTWREPGATCSRGGRSYSATWVGLGGYSLSSGALEQIGTEVDCTPSGRAVSSAWYELVPAPSVPIHMTVRAGDEMAASVTVIGHRVYVVLSDRTRHRQFKKSLHASTIDTSSAEWIEEAPSVCTSDTSCQTLPLANFGSVGFHTAYAQSSSGHTGSISDPRWGHTRIRLVPDGRRFVVYHGYGVPAGAAVTSGLGSGGAAFKVTFAEIQLQGGGVASDPASLAGGYLKHSGR